ncbi:unnamed protein product [Boreogadus saida]
MSVVSPPVDWPAPLKISERRSGASTPDRLLLHPRPHPSCNTQDPSRPTPPMNPPLPCSTHEPTPPMLHP